MSNAEFLESLINAVRRECLFNDIIARNRGNTAIPAVRAAKVNLSKVQEEISLTKEFLLEELTKAES